jgi:putative ABC transport system permease protein
LIGAIVTSRWQRVREGTLLRALGATRGQVLVILAVEYAALGVAASVIAAGLAGAAGWALARWFFGTRFVLPAGSLGLLAIAMVVLTVGVGLAGSLPVLRRPPLDVLRSD